MMLIFFTYSHFISYRSLRKLIVRNFHVKFFRLPSVYSFSLVLARQINFLQRAFQNYSKKLVMNNVIIKILQPLLLHALFSIVFGYYIVDLLSGCKAMS